MSNPIQALIITQDKVLQENLRAVLSGSREAVFAASFASGPEDCVAAAGGKKPDVVLWDLKVEKKGDLEVVSKLALEIPYAPILVLTALKNEEWALEAVRKGAQDYLIKTDINERMLSRVIRYAIGRKQAEETILKTRLQMERLLSAIPSILIGLNSRDEIIHWSSGAEKVLELDRDAVFRKALKDAPLRWDGERIMAGVMKCRETDEPVRVDNVTLKRSDREVLMGFTILPLKGEGQSDIILFGADVTEKKRLENMKDEFVSTVSHELRTPLLMIREGVALVGDGVLGPVNPEQKQYLGISLESIERLTRIINDLLDISKIEASKVRLRKEKTDLVSLVRTLEAGFQPVLRGSAVELKTSFSHPVIEAEVDKDKLTQVFTNLVQNAVKFTEKGNIKIGIEDSGREVLCSVSDTGRGISKEDIPQVFSKFQQFGRADGPGQKGTGLGLSICKGLVELHGGNIRVESCPGQGTSFIFTLPKK